MGSNGLSILEFILVVVVLVPIGFLLVDREKLKEEIQGFMNKSEDD